MRLSSGSPAGLMPLRVRKIMRLPQLVIPIGEDGET